MKHVLTRKYSHLAVEYATFGLKVIKLAVDERSSQRYCVIKNDAHTVCMANAPSAVKTPTACDTSIFLIKVVCSTALTLGKEGAARWERGVHLAQL